MILCSWELRLSLLWPLSSMLDLKAIPWSFATRQRVIQKKDVCLYISIVIILPKSDSKHGYIPWSIETNTRGAVVTRLCFHLHELAEHLVCPCQGLLSLKCTRWSFALAFILPLSPFVSNLNVCSGLSPIVSCPCFPDSLMVWKVLSDLKTLCLFSPPPLQPSFKFPFQSNIFKLHRLGLNVECKSPRQSEGNWNACLPPPTVTPSLGLPRVIVRHNAPCAQTRSQPVSLAWFPSAPTSQYSTAPCSMWWTWPPPVLQSASRRNTLGELDIQSAQESRWRCFMHTVPFEPVLEWDQTWVQQE